MIDLNKLKLFLMKKALKITILINLSVTASNDKFLAF